MDILYFAQTVFYLTFSFVVVVFGIVLILIVYNFLALISHLRRISRNLDSVSAEIKDNIIAIIERLAELPFMSMLTGKSKRSRKK